MKVIILAGGFGTRLAEYTNDIPKPMVPIGGKPILIHIMKLFAKFGHKDFYLALGYKSEAVKDYFINYHALNSDFAVDLSTGAVKVRKPSALDWTVSLIDTGLQTMTGGRVKRMKELIGNERCMVTYGDGISDIDMADLLRFHVGHKKMVTITAVRPVARFGELELGKSSQVTSFREKPQLSDGWINGGFLIIEPEFFDLIEGDSTFLEREPLEKAAKLGELMAYQHDGFWQCMDTKRDHDLLEAMFVAGAPWDH
jgi:glucose-1-phosphate cytidylyltransferase